MRLSQSPQQLQPLSQVPQGQRVGPSPKPTLLGDLWVPGAEWETGRALPGFGAATGELMRQWLEAPPLPPAQRHLPMLVALDKGEGRRGPSG